MELVARLNSGETIGDRVLKVDHAGEHGAVNIYRGQQLACWWRDAALRAAGGALARFLRQELSTRGLPGKDPIAEDWGYCVSIDNPAFDLWVGCGNYEEYPDGFLCFNEPKTPFVRKMFRKIDVRPRVEEVALALDERLRGHAGVHDLRWWPEGQT